MSLVYLYNKSKIATWIIVFWEIKDNKLLTFALALSYSEVCDLRLCMLTTSQSSLQIVFALRYYSFLLR